MQRLQSISTLVSLTASVWVFQGISTTAQIIPDNSLGSENSVVVPNVNINGIDSDRIDGGAIRGSNLFHSFQEFNIDNGRGAYFSNPENISNILSRVTGNNLSNILGTLGVLGNANTSAALSVNLFLINPNGIVFGPNARLDVGGSFFASTADSILFENGVEFAASNPDAPPLLTINIPIGLNFRENPGSIVNQSIAVDSEDNFVGLQVLPEKTLGFVGGDIQIEGGILTAPQGRIELGSVAGNSTVNLTPIDRGYALGYENVPSFQDTVLSQAAFVDVRGEGGGDIQVQGQRVTLTGGSVIEASTLGSEAGGVLTIQASESVEVVDSSIFADVNSGATGQGGNIIINTQNLLVQDGGRISTSTLGNGNAGNMSVQANQIEVIGINTNGRSSGLRATVGAEAFGNSGTLNIDTQNLSVRDGAQVLTSTFGNGNGGNLAVIATDIEVVGTSADGQIRSGLFTTVESEAIGNAGNLTINTQRLLVQDGARILADTFAEGNAGNLTINTQRLLVEDGGQISASIFGSGEGGNLSIIANEIELVGTSDENQSLSGLFAQTNPESIGNAGNLTIDTQRLLVEDGARISASTFGDGDAGNLTITATDIEVVGTSADGQTFTALSASVGSEAMGNAGTLTIDTQRLVVRDGARVLASTFGEGNAGQLSIRATELVEVTGDSSLITADVNSQAIGDGGDLTIDTQRLLAQDGGRISTSTFGDGNAGNLTITATNMELVGRSTDGQSSSGLRAIVGSEAIGNAGSLTINTQNLSVREGAQVLASTFGQGNVGSLTITATNMELVGRSADGQFSSALAASVEQGATGNSNSLIIDTQRLSVREGAQILAATFESGNAGNLTINATDVELVGRSADGQFSSALSASVEQGATGNGGTLTINTQNLSVRDGAQITAVTFADGDGGNLIVTAIDIEVVGTSADGQFRSGLFASVEPDATGNSNSLIIDTQNLSVRDGAFVSSSTFGDGNAGNLTVTATDVELIGTSADGQFPSTLGSEATSESTGQGGRLTVNTDNLTVRDGARIDVRSESTEAAGNLIINAPNILLDNQASLNGETTAGQGNITLNTSDLRLRNNSNITTNATGEATGGNITTNTETLTALENSDISANAEDAFGGRIIVNSTGIFGTAFREQQTRFSDITATSERGPEFSGTVELNTELDPSSGLIDLSQTVVDPNDLIAQEFCRQRGASQFIITGRGGIAADPNDKADGNQIEVDLVEPVPSQPRNTSQRRSRTNNNQPISSVTPSVAEGLDIIPARGWIRDENGDVILVSYDPTKTGVRRQPVQHPQCQP